MKNIKQLELINKYPNLFMDISKPPTETSMCFGLECGNGWYDLIDRTCEKIQRILNGRNLRFTQIKEKFGSLRIYTQPYIEEIDDIIDKAEDESFEICENCGTTNNVITTNYGWVYTRCNNCLKKLKDEGLI